jgi:Fe-S-cluster-containing hydrogenase component 2
VCANNCPYGNINLHEFEMPLAKPEFDIDDEGKVFVKKANVVRKATSCNLCHDHPEPSCVYACPHDAAHRVNPADFFSKVAKEKQAASAD